jgi:hypothetical protein
MILPSQAASEDRTVLPMLATAGPLPAGGQLAFEFGPADRQRPPSGSW